MNSRGSIAHFLVFCYSRTKQHWLPALIVFSAISSLGLLAALFQKPVYEAEGKIVLKRSNPVSQLTEVGKQVDQRDPLTNLGNPSLTESEIIRSNPIIQAALSKLNWLDKAGKPFLVSDFRDKLTVSAITSTDVLKIVYKDTDATKSADGVNKTMAAYLNYMVQSNQEEVVKTREFIEKRLPNAEDDVRRAETELRQFQQANQVLELTSKVTTAEGRTSAIETQISDAQAQLANTEAQMASLSQKLGMTPEQAITVAALNQSPEIQDTLKDIQTTETQLVRERDRFTENHPTVLQLEGNLEDLKALLQKKSAKILGNQQSSGLETLDTNLLIGAMKQDLSSDLVKLDSTRQGLVKQVKDLSTTLETYQQQSTRLPRLVQKQKDLERKVQAAQVGYTTLLQKLKETQIAENPNQGNAKVVAWAVPPEKPAGLGKPVIVALGIFLGLLGAAATICLLEALNKTIRSVEDAQTVFELTLLGIIPASDQGQNLLFYDGGQSYRIPEVSVRDNPGSPACEAYRLLQSNLKTIGNQRRCRVLVLTSSVPQEGTSTVCANLAAAIAQSGRRVLLIDANLHSPVQDAIWSIPNVEGLSNILTEEVAFWSAVNNVVENLDVLPAGNATSKSSVMLDSSHMELLIDHCSSLYDVVLLDSPALTVAADATLLGRLADGGILVVRPHHVDIDHVASAQPILQQWGKQLIGMIINGSVQTQISASDYGTDLQTMSPSSVAVGKLPIPPSNGDAKWLPLNLDEETEPYTSSQSIVYAPDLVHMSFAEIQTLVENLSRDWLRSTLLIKEQEEELDLQAQTVQELQGRLNSAGEPPRPAVSAYERLGLEVQIADEEERKRLLDQTLIGQRRRLREQHERLRQALHLLRERQTNSDSIPPDPFNPSSNDWSQSNGPQQV